MNIERTIEILKELIKCLNRMKIHCAYGFSGRKMARRTDLIEECKVLIKRLKKPELTWFSKEWTNEDVRLILSGIVSDCQKLDAYNTNN